MSQPLSLQDTANDVLSRVASRQTRSTRSTIGAHHLRQLTCSPNPLPVMILPPLAGILKKGARTQSKSRHPSGSVLQEGRNQLLRTLVFPNDAAALGARLTMADLEGRLEGLDGPARKPAGRKLSAFFAELLAQSAPRMAAESLPTTCVVHGP